MSIIDAVGKAITGDVSGAATSLVNIVLPEVSEVLGMLDKQMVNIDELVEKPLQSMVAEVEGGIWTGDGANAFVNECKTSFLPQAGSIKTSIGDISTRISNAEQAMVNADKTAAKQVGEFAQLCEKIYPQGG